MNILISSNFKKHFNTHIDFVDHNWIKYFDKNNHLFYLIPNSIKSSNNLSNNIDKIDLIILAGGNDLFGRDKLTKIRLKTEIKLIKFSIKNKIPLLGICRGMQVINYYFGGRIKKIKGHMRSKSLIYMKTNLFKKSKIRVNCFHNYCISPNIVSNQFEVLATDINNNVEMFKHNKHKIFGVMWHPEREKNFNRLNKIIKKLIK
tara:strand:+ start:91 stop:699 length:609 start_codon:yes stop_codon:yes gene_type:complete